MTAATRHEQLGDAPIEPRLHEMMNALARGVDEILNGPATPDRVKHNGFILLVFPFEGREGRCNYISNAQRADVLQLLKEQVARFEEQEKAGGP